MSFFIFIFQSQLSKYFIFWKCSVSAKYKLKTWLKNASTFTSSFQFMLNSERKQKKHRHLWLTRDDVTRGTTLFQSSYNSALFYVYSICYTNIQLNALTFDKCFSSEDSHTEISKRFAWNALSRWHFISASLHLLYLHMFIVQNHDNYYIILRLCQCVSSAHLTLQLPDKKSEVLITDTSDFTNSSTFPRL